MPDYPVQEESPIVNSSKERIFSNLFYISLTFFIIWWLIYVWKNDPFSGYNSIKRFFEEQSDNFINAILTTIPLIISYYISRKRYIAKKDSPNKGNFLTLLIILSITFLVTFTIVSIRVPEGWIISQTAIDHTILNLFLLFFVYLVSKKEISKSGFLWTSLVIGLIVLALISIQLKDSYQIIDRESSERELYNNILNNQNLPLEERIAGCISLDDSYCFIELAWRTKETRVCSSLDNSYGIKDRCLRKAIISSNNPELCNQMFSSEVSNSKCYFELGEYYNSTEYCDLVKDALLKSQCYIEVALNLEDVKFCSQALPLSEIMILQENSTHKAYFDSELEIAIKTREFCEVYLNTELSDKEKKTLYAKENNIRFE